MLRNRTCKYVYNGISKTCTFFSFSVLIEFRHRFMADTQVINFCTLYDLSLRYVINNISFDRIDLVFVEKVPKVKVHMIQRNSYLNYPTRALSPNGQHLEHLCLFRERINSMKWQLIMNDFSKNLLNVCFTRN